MTNLPQPGLNVVWLSPKQAKAFTRRAYNVPAHLMLDWTPPCIYVTRGATSYTAFRNARELRQWLAVDGRCRLQLSPRGRGMHTVGVRYGCVVER